MTFEKIVNVLEQILRYPLFTIKQTPVTLTSLLLLALVMLAFMILSKILLRSVLSKMLARTKLEESLQFTFMRITHYFVLVIGSVIAFQFVGIDLSGLIVIFGFLSVGIGFGLQNLTSNFISGLILLFERPIRVGDRVTVGEIEGDVEEINMRSTTIRSLNNISIIVPNSDFISSTVVNWSHGDIKIRIDIDIGVSYGSDLELVIRTLHDIAVANSEVRTEPEPEVLFQSFGDSAWNMNLRVWIDT
jgi:small-conductance mechanosensitive channel